MIKTAMTALLLLAAVVWLFLYAMVFEPAFGSPYMSQGMDASTMVLMDGDGGNVRINWAEVEKQARGRDLNLMPLAKALLAVRDKTWESMP